MSDPRFHIAQVHRVAARVMAALLVVTALGACGASRYSAEPTEAWVVDKTTGKPIEGVVVVASWELRWGFEGGSVLKMKILEASSDANGRFSIPGWGPEPVPSEAGFGARMRNDDPALLLFHPGYSYTRLQNSDLRIDREALDLPVRKSEHTGKRIELAPLPADNLKERAFNITLVLDELSRLDRPSHRATVVMPKLCGALALALPAFHDDWSRAEKAGYAPIDTNFKPFIPPAEAKCIAPVRR